LQNLGFKEIGLKLPVPDCPRCLTSGGFGYRDARVGLSISLQCRASKSVRGSQSVSERRAASGFPRRSRFAIGTAYMQVIASAAAWKRQGAAASAGELNRQTPNREAEVSSREDSSGGAPGNR
jgi:hypothetical protein